MNLGNLRDRATAIPVVVLMVLMGVVLWGSHSDRSRLAGDLEASEERIDELAGAVLSLNTQVEAEGGEPAVELEEDELGPRPVPGPGPSPGPEGPQGERGRQGPGPSDAQVSAAVERWCGENGCMGPEGPAPTATQVAEAVAAYCDDRGQCEGPAGSAGVNGEDGAAGPQGPAPTSEQIAAAVESYCAANNNCAGPTGPAGEDGDDSTVPGPVGPQGPAGPACPDNTDPIEWTVEERHAVTTGLDPGTYLVCRAIEGGE